MREQGKDEDRKDYMLMVAAEYIREHCPGGMIFYDDAECDGYCVADDCESAFEEITISIEDAIRIVKGG